MKTINNAKVNTRMVLSALILCFSSCLRPVVQAQESFFSQQADKQKLMLAQIVGYHTYLHLIKTGYAIMADGLDTAHSQKAGSFQLNSRYFRSLDQVSSVVQNDPRGKAIARDFQQIKTIFKNELAWQQQKKLLTPKELNYIGNVADNLFRQCSLDLGETTQLLTPGKLQLTDAQRLSSLDHLYAGMQDKKAFASAFTAKCRGLALNRQQASRDRGVLKSLYGIH